MLGGAWSLAHGVQHVTCPGDEHCFSFVEFSLPTYFLLCICWSCVSYSSDLTVLSEPHCEGSSLVFWSELGRRSGAEHNKCSFKLNWSSVVFICMSYLYSKIFKLRIS